MTEKDKNKLFEAISALGGTDASDEYSRGWDEAIDTVLNEIEKINKAEKPLKQYIVDGTYYLCPCCGRVLFNVNGFKIPELKEIVISDTQYCGSCGQRLDWGGCDE